MKLLNRLMMAGCALVLVSCSNGDGGQRAAQRSYEVTVTNLTAGQPMSPIALAVHGQGYRAFQLGSPVSVALENLAESGSNADLLADLGTQSTVYLSMGGTGVLTPGASQTLTLSMPLSTTQLIDLELTAVTMLVNTNDAITALNGVSVANLGVNQSLRLFAPVYDAGTEANSETADTIPGPAAAGGLREGFNSARDDVRDALHMHSGVVSSSDGLSSSVLTQAHRFDNPALQVVITRTL